MIECETPRMHRVLDDMACAAHFVATGEKILGRRVVSTTGISPLRDKDVDADPRAQHNPALGWLLRAFCETEAFPVRGVQPDLFWYQVAPTGAVRFVLHEAVEAFVVWSSSAPLVILEHAADWLEANERSDVADEYRRFTRESLAVEHREATDEVVKFRVTSEAGLGIARRFFGCPADLPKPARPSLYVPF